MISDTGIGLSKNELQQIFSRFHRVTETRSKDVRGVGLGLSIARSIAEAHGGRIHVDSIPGQGSTFTVHLPAYPTRVSQRPPAYRVAWISGRRPEKQMHVSALIVAVVTGCRAPGLKTTNQH
jgi:hypothetical protein